MVLRNYHHLFVSSEQKEPTEWKLEPNLADLVYFSLFFWKSWLYIQAFEMFFKNQLDSTLL